MREGVTLPQTVLYSRRATPRAKADDGVNALWYCNGRGDLSRVQDLNLGGIFIETSLQKDLGASIELYFLVREGPIHAKGIVRHVQPRHGLGLKLTAMTDKHCLNFGALMKRLYSARGDFGPARSNPEAGRATSAKSGPQSS